MLEKELERRLVEFVKQQGGMAIKWTAPGMRFVPDRICLLPGGRVAFVEMKQKTGRLHPGQKRFLDKLKRLGFITFVVRDDETFKQFRQWVAETGSAT